MLIAVDTNVLIDHAAGDSNVIDAVTTIRNRLSNAELLVTPTVLVELGWGLEHGDTATKRLFGEATDCMLEWGYNPINLIPVGHGIVESIGFKLRTNGIIPDEEVHDAFIVAEAALLGCSILLTSDKHLRIANDNPRFLPLLKDCEVEGDQLVVASPAVIARKFFYRK